MKADVAILLCACCLGGMTDIRSAAAQSATYNGIYAGVQTLTDSGNYSECLHGPFKRRLVVKDGAVTYQYNPTYHGIVAGTVNPAGDVSADAASPGGKVMLSGKIQGDEFTGELWSMLCTYSLQLKRLP